RAPEVYIIAAYIAARPLDLPVKFDNAFHTVLVIVVAYRLVTLLSTTAGYFIRKMVLAGGRDSAHLETAATATFGAKVLLWAGAFLFVMGNLGFNVSSMLAGLGIGGIAVALAAQAVLGDLFSAMAIYLDKPFMVGDAIKVGDAIGTVEHIGIKTTRVRALSGEMLVFPNSTLTSTRIQNFKHLDERRVVLSFAVPLATPVETLKRIPEQVRAVVTKTPTTRFDRSHLAVFRESGLEFESVFYVTSSDYGVYMDRRQAVLLGVLDALRADAIPLAQPVRTLVIEREAKAA
ncbi:MAG: mechanosensitive ion channel family protein, partial [Elusimicrobiota bacterium]